MTTAPENEPSDAQLPPELKTPDGAIPGERGIPSVNRARSLQSRVTTFLTVGFISVMTIGLLGWYYGRALSNPPDARHSKTSRKLIQTESKLPPLGRIHQPRTKPKSFWGDPPPLPETSSPGTPEVASPSSLATRARAPQASVATDRRLVGPVASSDRESFAPAKEEGVRSAQLPRPPASPRTDLNGLLQPASERSNQGALSDNLLPTATRAVTARRLPTQRLLIPKGSFVDCTLETAIDTSLPGLVTCITATDVFSADGTTVLLDRGTKLTGETKGDIKRGMARVFVLWTEARTPTGVVAELNSPGTDELGRSGLPGRVNRHFFERFGAAMLVSVIEASIDRATRPKGGGNVVLNTTASENIATEILKDTVRIPPTLIKDQGDRIQVLVARDIDFRSVYELRSVQ